MRYIWFSGNRPRRRVMHIARYTPQGEMLFAPLCASVHLPFDRSINAPFGLGQRVCRRCLHEASLPAGPVERTRG